MKACFDRYKSRRKCTVLASMTGFRLKQLLPSESSWGQDEGIWELCLLEKSPVERFDCLDTAAIRQQLSRLTRRKKYHLRYPNVPFVFQDRSTHHERESALKEFWETWDSLPEQRRLFLQRKRIPWDDVDKNSQAANKLLFQCPCPRLARIARLASIPIGRSLRTASILIYAVIGRFAPYISQLGGKTHEQRTPLRRLHEHIRRANYLFNYFTGQRRRNLRTTCKVVTRPSFGRALARVGGQKASILPLQQATPRNIDAREHAMEAALAPTLNAITPLGGFTNCEWIFSDLHTMPQTAEIQQVASKIITCRHIPFSAPQLVHILVESKRLLATKTNDRLYAQVAKYLSDSCKLRLFRRIPFEISGYSPALMSRVRTAALKHVNTHPFSIPVLRCFSTALSILPKKTERIVSVLNGYQNAAFNRDVKTLAKKLVPAQTATVGDRPVLHLFTCCSQTSRELLRTTLQPAKCMCNALKRPFPSLFAAGQQHLVCRTPDQWSTLLPEHILPVVLPNARTVTLPTHDFAEKSTQRLHEQFERYFSPFSEVDNSRHSFAR